MGNTRIYLGQDQNRPIFDPNGRAINCYELASIQALIAYQSREKPSTDLLRDTVLSLFEVTDLKDLKASAFNDVVSFLTGYGERH